MLKMQLYAVLFLLCLINFNDATQDKHKQALLRAQLTKAKSVREALMLLKASNTQGPEGLISPDAIKKEEKTIQSVAQQYVKDSRALTEPRNGGCEPRVVCEEVPVDRTNSENIVSYPQCVEVHRCGGCCQEPQFPCVPVREQPITFSPLLLISLDFTNRYEVNRPLTLMNHTQCECKCAKTDDQCRREGKLLDSTLCQCVQPRCSPECSISSTCSMVPDFDIPRCTCRRRIKGQSSNYCSNPDQRPNIMCTQCETFYG